ncbi:hypothetical protein Btru_063167 [Bulinus truncatus]|nr:hypothetical protein Btru_063167 [Bulinus truncatus]
MMRWLKDKKKEKKTSGAPEDGKEDDYGFDKEKQQASKSPPTKRQLPPTPATPEEKSPHIYEEIPDLPLCCTPDSEKALLHSKFKQGKAGGGKAPQGWSHGKKGDPADISPYMIVSVDKDVRQTPVDFHRTGTPEVHCDVIVKDTHCEILMTRKPKVGAFRLDSTALSGGKGNGSSGNAAAAAASSGSRGGNPHQFCPSGDRRISLDIQSSGKMSLYGSSAMSSTSRATSAGPHGSQSMSSFQDLQKQALQEMNDSGGGIVPYTCASNFIPRTKLTFHPLGGKDPRKEAFGSDCSDDSQTANLAARIRDDAASSVTNGVSYSSIQDACGPSKFVTYASVTEQPSPGATTGGKMESLSDKQSAFRFGDSPQSLFTADHESSGARAGLLIRPSSPSNSSSCTYASVNFPSEPKIYNTIPDVIPFDRSENAAGDANVRDCEVIYSTVNLSFDTQNSAATPEVGHPRNRHGHNNYQPYGDSQTNNSTDRARCGNAASNATRHAAQSLNGLSRDSPKTGATSACLERDTYAPSHSMMLGSETHYRRSLDLDFCSCSDELSSSCGCPESKNSTEDDSSSIAGTASDGPSSCKGCGRLIRQITYSESFSDETYEHVYASRLLTRNNRGRDSTELSFFETPPPEFRSSSSARSPDFMLAMSRDDTWALSRSDDTLPPAYGACDDNGFVSNYGESMSLKRRDSDISAYRVYRDSSGLSVGSVTAQKQCMRQNTSPVSHDVSMFCSLRATVSTSSIFSSRRSDAHGTILSKPTFETAPCSESIDASAAADSYPSDTSIKDSYADNSKPSVQSTSCSESKPNTFSGLFSKFTRPKTSKATKSDCSDICTVSSPAFSQINDNDNRSIIDPVSNNEGSDKNVKKLSKFFQRLSSKECTKLSSSASLSSMPDTDGEQSGACGKMCAPQETGLTLYDEVGVKSSKELISGASIRHAQNDAATGSRDSIDPCPTTTGQMHKAVSQTKMSPRCQPDAPHGLAAIASDVQREVAASRGAACTGAFDAMTSGRPPQVNTDSGDTCYEYDISTSSDGEQASYDYFLSKVKKTLNLEREVQSLGDTSAMRKRLLCKSCKKDEQLSTVETVEAGASGSSYWFCPHLSAKFGDLRAILADLVMDQRAAILDCLTDYAQGPYDVKAGASESHCRDCGFEVLDSESLATIYNLLSHPLNYPSGQTQSCDSDEGTMADNSCESADELCVDHNKVIGSEPEQQAPSKIKKKDKKGPTPSGAAACKEHATERVKSLSDAVVNIKNTHHHSSSNHPPPQHTAQAFDSASNKNYTASTSQARKNTSKKGTSHTTSLAQSYHSLPFNEQAENRDHSKCCPVSRSKSAAVFTDKAIQDIYSPLPTKALSLLTCRNYGPPAGTSCTCGRDFQASVTSTAAHLATNESAPPPPTAPPAATDLGDKTTNPPPPPSCHRPCDANNSREVPRVQTHLTHEATRGCGGEIPQHKGERDGIGERSKLSVNAENKTAASPVLKEPTTSVAAINAGLQNSEAIINDGHLPGRNVGAALSAPDKCAPPITSAGSKESPSAHRVSQSDGCDRGPADHASDVSSSRRRREAKQVDNNGSGEVDSARPNYKAQSRVPTTAVVDLSSQVKLSRRQRLELATLDLLPETVLCGDADQDPTDGGHPTKGKSRPFRPKRSRAVEKMAQLFEGGDIANSESADLKRNRSASCEKIRTHEIKTCDAALNNRAKAIAKDDVHPQHFAKIREKSAFSVFREPSESDHNLLTYYEPVEPTQKHRLHESNSSLKLSKDSLSDTVKVDLSGPYNTQAADGQTDHKETISPSPSSTASVSPTSSLSKKKNGGKHKRLNKKSHSKRRSRSRSERGRGSASRGEKTLYYLSSDLSDIDVVEVEDYETYAKNLQPLHPHHRGSKDSAGSAVRGHETGAHLYGDPPSSSDQKGGLNTSPQGADNVGCQECEQEIYALPPSSSELRGARDLHHHQQKQHQGEQRPGSASQSPELTKARKSLRTDVYKTVKNTNKLLTDVIIRNYDMQIYGNIIPIVGQEMRSLVRPRLAKK